MLALGGRTTELADALDIVKVYMETEFEGGRHERRVGMLNEMKGE
jgi:ribose 5-phosphate isomerase B